MLCLSFFLSIYTGDEMVCSIEKIFTEGKFDWRAREGREKKRHSVTNYQRGVAQCPLYSSIVFQKRDIERRFGDSLSLVVSVPNRLEFYLFSQPSTDMGMMAISFLSLSRRSLFPYQLLADWDHLRKDFFSGLSTLFS